MERLFNDHSSLGFEIGTICSHCGCIDCATIRHDSIGRSMWICRATGKKRNIHKGRKIKKE